VAVAVAVAVVVAVVVVVVLQKKLPPHVEIHSFGSP
jgi:hypothetical protein